MKITNWKQPKYWIFDLFVCCITFATTIPNPSHACHVSFPSYVLTLPSPSLAYHVHFSFMSWLYQTPLWHFTSFFPLMCPLYQTPLGMSRLFSILCFDYTKSLSGMSHLFSLMSPLYQTLLWRHVSFLSCVSTIPNPFRACHVFLLQLLYCIYAIFQIRICWLCQIKTDNFQD